MVLHCNQRHPGEVLTVLEHQIRHHGDVSCVSKVCQMLLKHHCWETVCDIIICVINASHKVRIISNIVFFVVLPQIVCDLIMCKSFKTTHKLQFQGLRMHAKTKRYLPIDGCDCYNWLYPACSVDIEFIVVEFFAVLANGHLL